MNKCESHNKATKKAWNERYKDGSHPPFYMITPAQFDLFERDNPSFLETCLVSLLLRFSKEDAGTTNTPS